MKIELVYYFDVMKIAIIGSDTKQRQEVVEKIQQRWTRFVSPAVNIDSSMDEINDDKAGFYARRKNKMLLTQFKDELHQELLKKMMLIESQLNEHKVEKNILFNGCTMDVLLRGFALMEEGKLDGELMQRLVGINRRVMEKLDLIYIVQNHNPDKRAIVQAKLKEEQGDDYKEPELTDEEKQEERMESLYRNFLDQYFANPEGNSIFPKEGAAMEAFITSDPVSEMADIVDEYGDLAGEDNKYSLEREQMLRKLFGGRSKKEIMQIMTAPDSIELKGNEDITHVELVNAEEVVCGKGE